MCVLKVDVEDEVTCPMDRNKAAEYLRHVLGQVPREGVDLVYERHLTICVRCQQWLRDAAQEHGRAMVHGAHPRSGDAARATPTRTPEHPPTFRENPVPPENVPFRLRLVGGGVVVILGFASLWAWSIGHTPYVDAQPGDSAFANSTPSGRASRSSLGSRGSDPSSLSRSADAPTPTHRLHGAPVNQSAKGVAAAMNQPTRDPGICPPVPSTPAARTYLVQKNDTFWEIAKRLYPDHPQDRQAVSDRTEKIRAANPTRFIGGAEVPVDPQNLPVGLEITLPDVPNTNPDSDSFSVSIEQGLA